MTGVCRGCGCTDEDCSGCIARTGEPCSWVEPDLCSACVEAIQARRRARRAASRGETRRQVQSTDRRRRA